MSDDEWEEVLFIYYENLGEITLNVQQGWKCTRHIC